MLSSIATFTRSLSTVTAPPSTSNHVQQSRTNSTHTTTTVEGIEQQEEEPASVFKVTLMRSAIGLTPGVRATVKALGFKRRLQSVYQPVGQASIGKILRVKELVKVETMTEQQKLQEIMEKQRPRSDKRGYSVVGSYL